MAALAVAVCECQEPRPAVRAARLGYCGGSRLANSVLCQERLALDLGI